jgi:hypothetical protein
MNKNLSTLSELRKQAPKHSGRFFKNNDWQKLFFIAKIIDDRPYDLLDENEKIAILLTMKNGTKDTDNFLVT